MSYARRHSTNVCPGNRVRYTITQARKTGGKLRNRTVKDALGVSEEEAQYFASFRDAPDTNPTLKQADRQLKLLELVEEYTQLGLPLPNPPQMSVQLNMLGFRGNPVTIWRDYKALGLPTNKRTRAA